MIGDSDRSILLLTASFNHQPSFTLVVMHSEMKRQHMICEKERREERGGRGRGERETKRSSVLRMSSIPEKKLVFTKGTRRREWLGGRGCG